MLCLCPQEGRIGSGMSARVRCFDVAFGEDCQMAAQRLCACPFFDNYSTWCYPAQLVILTSHILLLII